MIARFTQGPVYLSLPPLLVVENVPIKARGERFGHSK
jgi:hypothetical protein